MTEEPTSGDESARQPNPTPVTVVGYPDHAPVSSGQSVPGLAGVKMAIMSLRAIVVVTLVLVLIVTASLVAGMVLLRGQMSALSDQVAALSTDQAASTAVAPQIGQPGELADAAAAPQGATQSQVPQLPAAPALPAGIPVPDGLDASGAILVGDPQASNVVEIYLDYQCPFCQRWESEIGGSLNERAIQHDSNLLVKHYVLAFLGETSPTLDPPGASARAASAAVCVVEGEGSEAFALFSQRVYALADPSEPPDQFATDVLSQMAVDLGASDATLECIDQERHVTFVALGTQTGFGRGVQGTPTVIVNGRTVDNAFGDAELISLLS